MVANTLPIHELATELSAALHEETVGRRFIIDAPTGSGKSTQVPGFLADSDAIDGQILVLQPRRLAARMLAARVASERSTKLGNGVGYHIRFDRKASRETSIVYMTEGIFVRRVLSDPQLKGVGAVVLDEFHERHLDTDLGLALAMHLQETTRPDLALLVMSATLPGAELGKHLGDSCHSLQSKGRTFPVEIDYLKPKSASARQGRRATPGEPVWETAARACRSIIEDPDGSPGDILVFMPGGFEIHRTIQEIDGRSWARGIDVLPLHGELSHDAQDRAVSGGPGGERRKIIVATNIAETSLTIPGVTAVVDSGLARISSFDRSRGINTLHVRPISQASADQRAGRAGRVAPGRCLRLWSDRSHATRAEQETPEIHRIDLSQPLLVLLASGIRDPLSLPWLEPPHPNSLARALKCLSELGAIIPPDDLHAPGTIELTPEGAEMARFPAHPRIARMIAAARDLGVLEAGVVCAALVSERDVFVRNRGLSATIEKHSERGDESDLLPRLRALAKAEAAAFRTDRCAELGIHANTARGVIKTVGSFLDVVRRLGWDATPSGSGGRWQEFRDARAIARFMLAGFADQVAARPLAGSNLCNLSGGRKGRLAAETVLQATEPMMVAGEIVEIEGKSLEVTLNLATSIDEALLEEVDPSGFETVESTSYDSTSRRVIGTQEKRFRGVILKSKETGEPDPDQAAAMLASEVAAGRLVLKKWDAKAEQWIERVNFLAAAMPELQVDPIDEEARLALIEQVCLGAVRYKQLKDRDVWPALRGWLAAPQIQAIESYAPERVKLPRGRSAKVTYGGETPKISATIQDLYDLNENPTLAGGGVRALVEVLGPNRRPVQTTADIRGFWENSYAAIRKDLKGRYPKHEWR